MALPREGAAAAGHGAALCAARGAAAAALRAAASLSLSLSLTALLPAAARAAEGEAEVGLWLRLETADAPGAGTDRGAVVAFEVAGAWLEEQALCNEASRDAAVEFSGAFAEWPTRLRLRARPASAGGDAGDAGADAWGLQRIVATHVATGQEMPLLPAAGEPSSAERWVTSDVRYTTFEVPSLGGLGFGPAWDIGAWGACCCPTSDPLVAGCTPGFRQRPVACPAPAGAGACDASGARPVEEEPCDDHSECAYEAMCPLGRNHSLGCDWQALIILSIFLVFAILTAMACRHCRTEWFPCCRRQRSRGASAASVKHIADGSEAAEAAAGIPGDAAPAAAGRLGLDEAAFRRALAGGPGSEENLAGEGRRAAELREAQLLGTWCYDRASRYAIGRTAQGRLRFDEHISSGQRVCGLLEPCDGWYQAKISVLDSDEEHGTVRLRYSFEDGGMLSNFQIPGEDLWGPDTLARRTQTPAGAEGGLVAHEGPLAPLHALASAAVGATGAGGDARATTLTKLSGSWDVAVRGGEHRGDAAAAAAAARPPSPRRAAGRGPSPAALNLCCAGPEGPGSAGGSPRRGPPGRGEETTTPSLIENFSANLGLTCDLGRDADLVAVAEAEAMAPDVMPSAITPQGTPRAPRTVPRVLYVVSPRFHPACAGAYELVPGERPNGEPLWRRRGGGRWMYTGLDGKWYIGGPSSREKNFDCAAGYLFRDQRHGGLTPDAVGGVWARGDGETWCPETSIVVAAAPTAPAGLGAPEAAGDPPPPPALGAAGEPREQEDGPGVYVITHDNAAVTASVLPSPPVIQRLALGAVVTVKEVVFRPCEDRVRARLEAPAGWISLRDTKDGYRWARRDLQGLSDASTRDTSSSGSSRRSREAQCAGASRAAQTPPAPPAPPEPPAGPRR